ncbi:MAG: hypothetical protein ACHQX3_02025 [Nitrospirales bacterium]
MNSIDAELNEQVVATVMGKQVTRGQLSAAFEKVRNREHWKNPINAKLKNQNEEDLAMIQEAVTFFTGSVAEISTNSAGMTRVQADGYFLTCGA